MKIIRELDFRFPPNSQTSGADREARVLMLGSDVADVPTHLLAKAADAWVRTNAWMPKASELINLAQAALPPKLATGRTFRSWVHERNRRLEDDGNPRRQIWILEGEGEGSGMHMEFLPHEGAMT